MERDFALYVHGASQEWLDRLARMFAELPTGAAVPSLSPVTAAAAYRLIDNVTLDARHLLRLAVEGDGKAAGATFRAQRGEGKLNGATTSLTRILKSGIKAGWWPADVPRVLKPTGPDRNGWSKTAAYHLDEALLPVFREAFADYDQRNRHGEHTPTPASTVHAERPTALARLTEVYAEQGHPHHRAVDFATDLLAQHTDELADLLRAHGHTAAAEDLDALNP
ncbi:hypothetical protein [Streptomyces sp. NPDC091259]|uniref:hypothetical protein n=1 Tax=Streptomyces sp. NPDC091259 TaxID=3365976 RepID=UPI0037F7A871